MPKMTTLKATSSHAKGALGAAKSPSFPIISQGITGTLVWAETDTPLNSGVNKIG
jgi:hypothetical protein